MANPADNRSRFGRIEPDESDESGSQARPELGLFPRIMGPEDEERLGAATSSGNDLTVPWAFPAPSALCPLSAATAHRRFPEYTFVNMLYTHVDRMLRDT